MAKIKGVSSREFKQISHLESLWTRSYFVSTAKIVWKNGYYLYYTYDYETEKLKNLNNKVGIDLGEIHSIAMCDEKGNSLIISNSLSRSIKQFRNKMYGYISKRLSKCTKGSRKYRKLLKLKNKIRNKTDNQLKNLYHQATRKAVNFCVEHNVAEIILGDIKGIEKNTKKKKKLNRKSPQMQYGKIKDYLKYKAKEIGIKISLVKENWTSQTCPVCGNRHKPTGRDYECKYGIKTHRDLVGAWNILNKKYKNEYIGFNIKHVQPIKVSTV